ncbi:Cleft lip and palate transmembrane protein 1 [Auxenochlorella protothecoides]|uniref:Cleft lip and palate transmembrane protein 1 n=1 Tax=Auxenochlorella protothecoides TaxID=3075 RepID=A0A087SP72_AUXPR|nr:Cleft lip and palate transmembrane protein 1 [Auxenochlorella protothecoides]KFM27526.1 Cleft lip and palate transmembrane protein 1 [Auxenochlorella protothecoides]
MICPTLGQSGQNGFVYSSIHSSSEVRGVRKGFHTLVARHPGVSSYLMKTFFGGQKSTPIPSATPGSPDLPALPAETLPRLARSTPVDVHVYISEANDWQASAKQGPPLWSATEFELGTGSTQATALVYAPSHAVQNNGSVFFHAVFTPSGASPDPADGFHDAALTFAKSQPLNVYLKKPRAGTGINLLTGKNSTGNEAAPEDVHTGNDTVIVSFLRPNVTIAVVDDFKKYQLRQIPPQYKGFVDMDEVTLTYAPFVWYNNFWLLRDYLIPLNETVSEVTLHISVETIHALKFAFFTQASEDGAVKRIFLEGNPFFLALTMAVSLLHSLFDMLAFKNDIGFWKNNKSMVGLSARTIMINAGCQLIIFLYLLDNETSYVILFSSGMGTAIELWKVTKAMDISDRLSYTQSRTDEYDAEAMRYLSYALYPLILGYAVYALVYQTHKSWYSWVLNSLVGAVYTFGFILMCPQLYLNYKLKSVAHLPWRQMSYKFLNTIIDDLFAFVIKMPLLHRLSVFRDDVVFLVYLYQRWIYRVDKKRANEFGYVEEGDPAVDAQVEGVGAAIAGTDGVGTSETDGPAPDPVSGENVETKKDQ